MNLFRISRTFIGCCALLCGVSVVEADTPFQISFTPGANGMWNADWIGPDSGPYDATHRVFFFQWSLDLVHWNYAPFIEFGPGLKRYGMDTQGEPKCFVRLRFDDADWIVDLQGARDADLDGDGIPNWFEVEQLFSDPLDKNSNGGDSDNDGLPDGWELFHFGDLTSADGSGDSDGDTLSNAYEAALGMNPNAGIQIVTEADLQLFIPNEQ